MNSVLKRGDKVKGILIDITGVLYESGTSHAIDGSIEAFNLLKSSGLPFKFVTNESQNTRHGLVTKLQGFGFTSLEVDDILAPTPVARDFIIRNGLIPHLLVHPKSAPELDQLPIPSKEQPATCVVMGDVADDFTYENMNKAFTALRNMQSPLLLALGYGMYYQHEGQPVLDIGAYAKVLEASCNVKATILGKPSPLYYQRGLELINTKAEDAVMIGDDLISDVSGSQAVGMSGIQVETGKFNESRDRNHPQVKPDYFATNFNDAISFIMKHNETTG